MTKVGDGSGPAEITRYLVRQLLPRGRYTFEIASDGAEGLQRLHAQCPDVVLLDVNMPEMTGYQFLEALHDEAIGGNEAVAHVPIIVLTSAILTPDDRSLLHRASMILSKSDLSAGTLIDAIEGVLHRSQPIPAQ